MTRFKRFAKNTALVFIARSFESFAAFLLIMMLARYLGIHLYGKYAWIVSIILAFQPLINLELNTILIRELSRRPERRHVLVGGGVLLKLLLLCVFIVSALLLDQYLNLTGYVAAAFYIAVAGEIAQQIYWLFSTVYMAAERMEFETFNSLIWRMTALTGVFLLFMTDGYPGPERIVFVFSILTLGQILRAANTLRIAFRHFIREKLFLSFTEMKWLFSRIWIMGLATFLTGLSLRVDVYFLEYFIGSEAVSFFHIPHMIILQLQVIAVAVTTALFPILSQWASNRLDRERFRSGVDLSLRILLVVGLSFTLVLELFAPEIILIAGGKTFLNAAVVLRILAFCIPVLFMNFLVCNILISLNRQDYLIYGAFLSLAVNVILDYRYVPTHGGVGAAWATLIAYTLQIIVLLAFLKYRLKKELQVMNVFLLPLLIAASAAILDIRFTFPGFQGYLIKCGLLITGILLMVLSQPGQVKKYIILQLRRKQQ